VILDEVLAVGDAAFQAKSIDKIEQLANDESRTILFVSHNLTSVRRLCHRVLVLDAGRLTFDGDTATGLARYMDRFEPETVRGGTFDLTARSNPFPPHNLLVHTLSISDGSGAPTSSLPANSSLCFDLGLAELDLCDVYLVLRIASETDVPIVTFSTLTERSLSEAKGVSRLRLQVPHSGLAPGRYNLHLGVVRKDGPDVDTVPHAGWIRVGTRADAAQRGHLYSEDIVVMTHDWSAR
jgi:hypothetical protein